MTAQVAVTGIGLVTPIGIDREDFWSAASLGKSGTEALRSLPLQFSVEAFNSRVVAPVRWQSQALGSHSRQHRLAALALRQALSDARIRSLAGQRSAVVVGTAVAATPEMETDYLSICSSCPGSQSAGRNALLRRLSFHTLAHELATACECRGPVLTASTGCTAGLDAIGMAFELIRSGEVELALAGAAEAPITPVVFAAFDVIGALSCQNERPQRASRPFDKERDGFVLGEGAALLVLERLDRARARGAHVYGEISGFASVNNCYHMTDLPAEGDALAQCMREALSDARLSPDDVDHVNAHGSSTPQNDICETNAIKAVFRQRAYSVPVTAVKSMVGHALGASNAIEVAACALMLERHFLLPTINLDSAGPGCDLDYVANLGRRAKVRNLLKLSNGFSGIHSVLAMTAL